MGRATSVNLNEEIAILLKELAEAESRPISNMINKLLKDELEKGVIQDDEM